MNKPFKIATKHLHFKVICTEGHQTTNTKEWKTIL